MQLRKILLLGVLACFALSGCDRKLELNLAPLVRNTPTPAPSTGKGSSGTSATRTPAPTATSAPSRAGMTATPSPRRVGIREGSAGSVLVSNSSGQRIREIYLQTSGAENWGRNLIPGEASVHVGESFQLYYPPLGSAGSYNLRMLDNNGITYEIYGVDLADMQNAILRKGEDNNVYLSYMSLASGQEKDTRGSSWSSGDTGAEEVEESQYFDSSGFYPFTDRRVTGTPAPESSGFEDDSGEWDYIGDGTDAWDYGGGENSGYNDGSYEESPNEFYGIPYDDEWDYQSEYGY